MKAPSVGKMKTPGSPINQARGALHSLLYKCYNLHLPINLQLQLFDQVVLPVLTYRCEVWAGFEDISGLESFYIKFCKQFLKGKNISTPDCMVLGEMGRSKLAKFIELRMGIFVQEL